MSVLRTIGLGSILIASLASAAEKKVVLGYLGQTLEAAQITSRMDGRSRVYYKAKPFEYIVVSGTKFPNWSRVLLQNGKYGYIPTSKIASLPYEVVAPPRRSAPSTSRSGSRLPSKSVDAMLQYSFNFIGTPYVWGGNSLTKGVDCSGFVQQLFGKIGIDMPRIARAQEKVGQKIENFQDLRPGDRLYFHDPKLGRIGHTGIFLGFFKDGAPYFIHSSSGRKGVAVDDLRKKYWRTNLVSARRS